MSLPVLSPDLQVSFYQRLEAVRQVYLWPALSDTVSRVDLRVVDRELREMTPEGAIQLIARWGLRGETFFPVPVLLRENPFLLGYYRLLYGLSQKEFYGKGPFGRFKSMEDRGEISPRAERELTELCRSLAETGARLASKLDPVSRDLLHELQLLTLGPQFRGSANTKIGDAATQQVFDIIRSIVGDHITEMTRRSMTLTNAAGRLVLIEFASDPDVHVTEKMSNAVRQILSIEIKGGADVSNIHNRLGEAEKSHLKAKKLGCSEFWTILRVPLTADVASRGSPTTTRFFQLDEILQSDGERARMFREELVARLGITSD